MNLEQAKKWIKWNYNLKKIDITDHFFRFRQLEPSYLKKIGYTNYRNKKLPNGIELIIAMKG